MTYIAWAGAGLTSFPGDGLVRKKLLKNCHIIKETKQIRLQVTGNRHVIPG